MGTVASCLCFGLRAIIYEVEVNEIVRVVITWKSAFDDILKGECSVLLHVLPCE
jgi:hypothetical protein